jgi:hypothetical protein
MQCDALEALYRLESRVKACKDANLLTVWRKLQSSDHFYYMCTKWFAADDVQRYFNPYGSPYDAYINFMNVLGDFELTLQQSASADTSPSSLAAGDIALGPRPRAGAARKTKAAAAPGKAETRKKTAGKNDAANTAGGKTGAAKKTSSGGSRAGKKK